MQFDISVVIEWENILLAEDERCSLMMREIRRQAVAQNRAVEVVILFNPEQVSLSTVEMGVQQHLYFPDENSQVLQCRIEAALGLHYYQLKNYGAQISHGKVIVFIDTDVIPDSGWLSEMTSPFFNCPEIQVLAGHTYLDPQDLVSRSFALGWFFPVRTESPELIKGAPSFFANNVAFRRKTFDQHPFPEMPDGMTRGACNLLTKTLHNEKIEIWKNCVAQVSHPAPNGINHFINRGFAEGRDWAMQRKERGKWVVSTNIIVTRKIFNKTLRMMKRIFQHRKHVGLPVWQTPLALGIMIVYFVEICIGAWAYSVAPRITRKIWRV